MALRTDDISINTIIGKGSAISGNMKINGFIRIDGDIDGSLETDGNVIVGENARIHGDLTAKSVIIGGIIKGNILAKKIKILKDAEVEGNIEYTCLAIEDGAKIIGSFSVVAENIVAEKINSAKPNFCYKYCNYYDKTHPEKGEWHITKKDINEFCLIPK